MATKQPSRKGKKAWRKNVDITDVSTGLENLREEIIQGGVVKEKPNDELFALDTTGDLKVAQSVSKKLKSDEILAARSAVPAIEGRKRAYTPTSTSTSTAVSISTLPVQKKRRSNGVSYNEISRLRDIANRVEHPLDKDAPGVKVDYDPWTIAPPAVADKIVQRIDKAGLSFLQAPQAVKEPRTLKQPPVSLAVMGKPVPAVRVPEAGTSYNPEFEGWDELLRAEGEKAVEEEEKRLAEVQERERIKALAAVPEPDPQSDEDESGSSDGESEEEKVVKKRPERKTQAQRNKIARRKERERRVLLEKKARKQRMELALVRKYAKDVDCRERERALRKKITIEDDDKNPKVMRKRKFGKAAIPKAPLELLLPDELADSLRTLKPEGSLLRDRLRSLRERGMLETRLQITARRRYARKTTERWSYKDFK